MVLAMHKCWANGHGECSNKISREHLISSGIFEDQNILIGGDPWCQGSERKISVASLTAKILCTKHNSAISPLDEEGINAVRLFEQFFPDNMKSNHKAPFKDVINGHLFERWLLKTAINNSVKSDLHIGIGMSDSSLGKPSPYLLAVVFGELQFTHQMGLYVIGNSAPISLTAGQITIIPVHRDGNIGGFYFHIRGLNVFLSLYPSHPVPSLKSLGMTEEVGFFKGLLDSVPVYRPAYITVFDECLAPQQVAFSW